MSHEFVRYESRMLGQLADLQKRLWSGDAELNGEYFTWKHERNPCGSGPQVFVAMQAGRAIAMRGFVSSRWEGGRDAGPPLPLPLAADNVVDPEHEGTGVAAALTNCALEDLARRGVPCVLNLRASPVTLIGSLAGGWKATPALEAVEHGNAGADNPLRAGVQRLPVLWRLASHRLLDNAEERRPFRNLDAHGAQRLRQISGRLTLEREPPVAAMAELVGRLRHDGRLRQVRDEPWLAWKYANPLRSYRFICWDEGRLEGYVALEKSVVPGSERLRVAIVDCEAADDAILESLLQATLTALPDQALLAWRRAMPVAAMSMLDRLDFRPPPRRNSLQRQCPCLLIKPLGASGWRLRGMDALDPGSWDLRDLYGD